jgi:hypothetical protein
VVPPNLKGSAEQLKERERINVRLRETKQKAILEKKQHKIMVVGDSHARGCATQLIGNLGEAFEVTGFVKPGTGLEVITTIESEGINKLTKKDVVVIWGGSHDIAKNAVITGLKHMVKFVKEKNNTNIVIMEAPQRHDLSTLSCVNNEVIVFNRKLQKMMKTYNNIKILDVDISRGNFTHLGLHMNGTGKEKMARKISEVVKKMVTRKEETPITLVWKDKSVGKSGGTEEKSDISEKKEIDVRTSGRKRKQPVARRDDFLWTLSHTIEV